MKDVENKMIRKLIIALVVLVVVIGDLIYYKSKDPEIVATEMVELIKIDKSELEKVEVQDNSDDEIVVYTTFEGEEDGIVEAERVAKYKETATKKEKDLKNIEHPSGSVIALFEFSITNVQALKTIQEEATDLEQFGLNDPLCVIDMKLKNGEEKGIIIGDTTPTTKSAYYMKLKDSNTVYTISVWDVNNFLLTNKNL